MRTTHLLAAACLMALPLLAAAQNPRLKIPSFEDLQHKAVDSVNIDFGSLMLHLAAHFMDENDPDVAQVKKTLLSLKSVQVRSFRFDSDFAYSKSDIDSIRSQLSEPGWSRLVQVRDRKENQDVDIYLAVDKHIINGIAIITSEPREFSIVNVVGKVDMDQIAQLQRTFAPSGEHLDANQAETP